MHRLGHDFEAFADVIVATDLIDAAVQLLHPFEVLAVNGPLVLFSSSGRHRRTGTSVEIVEVNQ
jgi:hypothetical protein